MDSKELRRYALNIVPKKDKDVFSKLYDNGIIDKPKLLKGCINHFYDERYKQNDCHSLNTLIDASIEFNITTLAVKNVIYKFRDVRLVF